MQKFLSMLGFAMKSGKIITGDDTCEMFMKKGKIKLLIVAADASENTKDKFRSKTTQYNVQLIEVSTKEELSQAIGKFNRAVIGITDRKFTNSLIQLLEQAVNK
jgi:ribosomal protein L7Ae-like RNA K-turn-binding protein